MRPPARKSIAKGRPLGSKSADPIIAAAFGQAVVSLRIAAGISQESLALSAAIGRSNMSAIENGRTVPNFVGVVKIATALDCSLAVLVEEFDKAYRLALEAASDTTQ